MLIDLHVLQTSHLHGGSRWKELELLAREPSATWHATYVGVSMGRSSSLASNWMKGLKSNASLVGELLEFGPGTSLPPSDHPGWVHVRLSCLQVLRTAVDLGRFWKFVFHVFFHQFPLISTTSLHISILYV